MTGSDDDVWNDMSHFDSYLADAVWRGDAPADDAPSWYGEVATLVRTAQTPATADELAGEDDIVAAMQQALREADAEREAASSPGLTLVGGTALNGSNGDAADDDHVPRHLSKVTGSGADDDADDIDDAGDVHDGEDGGQGRVVHIVGRVVAAKAVAAAAIAIGITAAAATTGIVRVVVPTLNDKPPAEETPSTSVPADGTGGGSSSTGDGGSFSRGPRDDAPGAATSEVTASTTGDPAAGDPAVTTTSTVAPGEDGTAGDPVTTEGTVTDPAVTTTTTSTVPGTTTEPTTTTTTEPTTTTVDPTTTTVSTPSSEASTTELSPFSAAGESAASGPGGLA